MTETTNQEPFSKTYFCEGCGNEDEGEWCEFEVPISVLNRGNPRFCPISGAECKWHAGGETIMTKVTTTKAYRCKDIESIIEEMDAKEPYRFYNLYGILVDDNGSDPDGTANLIPCEMVKEEDKAIFEKFSDIVEIRSIEIGYDTYDEVLRKLLDREENLKWFYNQSYSDDLMMIQSPAADFIFEIAEGLNALIEDVQAPSMFRR